jgi:hypothetical protein
MKVCNQKSPETKKEERFRGQGDTRSQSTLGPGAFIASHDSIDQVPYKTAYSKPQGREGSKKGKLKITVKLSEISIVSPNKEPKTETGGK